MGRRHFYIYLGIDDSNISKRLAKCLKLIDAHNNADFNDRGEYIDTVEKLIYNESDKYFEYLVFSSGGGDWVTEEFYENKFPNFYKSLKRSDDFESISPIHKNWWDNKNWSRVMIRDEISPDLLSVMKQISKSS